MALTGAASIGVIVDAQQGEIRSGRNTNMNPGIVNPFIGDPYLQRQVETKHAIAINNTRMVVALANDYRTVDFSQDQGFGEGLGAVFAALFGVKSYLAFAPPDAWLGFYRSKDGAVSFVNGLVPGFPTDTSELGKSQPWYGLAAASDAAVAADARGHFHGAGLFFNRGGTGIIGYFRATNYNDESSLPIRFDAGLSKAIETTSATATGLFADLPSMIWDAHEPRTGSRGQGGGCGHVYLGYTLFAGAPTNNSHIKFTKSTDCGETFTRPIAIQGKFKKNQRVVLMVDPRPGTPRTTGGGTLYAVWTSFEPRQIVMARSQDQGETWSEPVAVTALSGPASMCSYDQPTNGVNEVSNPAEESARSLAFATGQVGLDGAITLAWPERVEHNRASQNFGRPLAAAACVTDGPLAVPPKIVVTRSLNGGATWTPRAAIDMGVRCEARTPNQLGPFDLSAPDAAENSCAAGSVERPAGAQLQPVLSQNAGKLVLMYLEGRADPSRSPDDPLGTTGYHSGRNAQVDVRAAEISATTGQLLKTIQVSQYTLDVNAGDIKAVEGATNPANAKAYNRAYMLQYKGGTISFMGDHNDLAPFEPVVFDPTPRLATAADVPSASFLGTWGGDNREARFPGGDLFDNFAATQYDPPGSGMPSACNGGARNSNGYSAYVGPRMEAFVHQSFKPLGGIQRTWAVTIRNRSSSQLILRMALQEKQGFDGSFDQLQDVDVIGNNDGDPFCANAAYPSCTARRTIQPHSSMTFTVFASGLAAPTAAPVKIQIDDVGNGLCSFSAFSGCDAIVRLNPAPTNPSPLAGSNITTSEHHGPKVNGPFVSTHGNPTQGNPTQGNPTQGNPTQGNPTQGNTGFSEYTDYTFTVKAQDANTISQYSSFANIANPELVDASHLIQLIITRLQSVPTLGKAEDGCPAVETPEDEVLSMITLDKAENVAPTQGNPTQGNPTQGNPTQGNPTQGNPTQGNPTQGNNTYALAPGDAPSSAAARARYRATAIASAVNAALSPFQESLAPDGTLTALPPPDEVRVTLRFFHCDDSAGTCSVGGKTFTTETPQTETVPRDPGDAANALIGFVAVAGAGDNNNGIITPPEFDGTGPDLVISFPASVGVSPSTVVAGDTISLPGGFTVRNQGQQSTAGSFENGIYLSSDFLITAADTLVSSLTNFPLLPDGTASFPFEGTLSFDVPAGIPAGSYFVGYLADHSNRIGETNEGNNFASAATAQLTIVPPPTITTETLPSGMVTVAYPNTQLQATGGVGALQWMLLEGGALPPGLSLSSSGVISGTPTATGSYSFTVQVDDSAPSPHNDTQELTIVVSSLVVTGDYVSAGLGGVRGTDSGTINISGVSGTVTKALLYWHGPTNPSEGNPTPNSSITFTGASISGTFLGAAYDNNWAFADSQAYRADVTSLVTAGQTSYSVGNLRKGGGATAEINGLSLLVFFDDGNAANDRTVYVFDGHDSNGPLIGNWSVPMDGITFMAGATASLELHVSDGQSFPDDALVLDDLQLVPGPQIFDGASVPDQGTASSWDGGLWDIRTFDVTAFLSPGSNGLTLETGRDNDYLSLVVAAVVVGPGPSGSALSFDGVDDLVSIADNATLDLSTLTVEGWVLVQDSELLEGPLLSKGVEFGNYTLSVGGALDAPPPPGNVRYRHLWSDGNVSCCSVDPENAGPVAFGRWTHVAATYDGAILRTYVNGALVASLSDAPAPVQNAGSLLLGQIAFISAESRRLRGLLTRCASGTWRERQPRSARATTVS